MSKFIIYKSNIMDNWANETLTAEELAQYQAAVEANNILWKSYQDQGLYTVEDLYETVYSESIGANINVLVGNKMTMANDTNLHELEQDSDYKNWVSRFSSETGNTIPGVIQVE